MAKDIFLRIAEISIGLSSDLMGTKIQLTGATQKFFIEDAIPDMKIRVLWDKLRKEARGKQVFDSGSTWKLYDQSGSHLIRLTAPVYGSIPYKEAIFNPEFSRGEVRLHRPFFPPGQPLNPLEYPLDELLITNYLARGKGVEVHACGIADSRGDGFLFLGQSGAGKSTMARLWEDRPGITVLSDDRIIIRRKEGTFWIHGTPWHGDSHASLPGCARLKSVFFLGKGARNELIPLSRSESSGRLFACSFPPFYSKDALEFILSFLGKIVEQTPCYEFRFFPDSKVIPLLQNLT